ncbi:hypothetical protein PVL29_010014 [Vitis rotundifolia]|uniref:Uncharacterized protein n=1 Tax=Vitis rotundifolia TaxID=103349 RepID=A0AA38ZTX4_VITRO|nr:hypothetical protein PVL29_010014 [Vitis rotundifolia]
MDPLSQHLELSAEGSTHAQDRVKHKKHPLDAKNILPNHSMHWHELGVDEERRKTSVEHHSPSNRLTNTQWKTPRSWDVF